MANTDAVIARALAEVAACKALRERMLVHRAEMQKQTEAPPTIYVLRKGNQLGLNLQ